MKPKRHTLDRIFGWVGYGCAYSVNEEEAQAHRARQPDEEAATERRSVAVWAAADDTRGLSDEQLCTRLGILGFADRGSAGSHGRRGRPINGTLRVRPVKQSDRTGCVLEEDAMEIFRSFGSGVEYKSV